MQKLDIFNRAHVNTTHQGDITPENISKEFFFLTFIKQFYINSLNYSYTIGNLTELQTQCIITLKQKNNKDTSNI